MKLHPETVFFIVTENGPAVYSRPVSADEEKETTHVTQIFCAGHHYSTLT